MHVLVVEDSAVVRQALRLVLEHAGFTVTLAADPVVAALRMRAARPDVVVLDLELPRVHGLDFLRALMAEAPLPVVVCSAAASAGSELAVRALEEGALAIVEKPRLDARAVPQEAAARLVEAVAAAARSRPKGSGPAPVAAGPAPVAVPGAARRVIAIGASLGGTEAIRVVLQGLPRDAPGVAIVQHMPRAFTAPFARRLRELTGLDVSEARDGAPLLPGRALVAPGDRHLAVRRCEGGYCATVTGGPPVSRHRPSVDVLFGSAALAAGADAVGVLLTGMGDDGAEGLVALRRAGAVTLAQDEATSVVYGMPREAARRGGAVHVLPLARIAPAILEALSAGRAARPGGPGPA